MSVLSLRNVPPAVASPAAALFRLDEADGKAPAERTQWPAGSVGAARRASE